MPPHALNEFRLGTAVVTLPLHHPIRAAEDTALIDVLSGGRLELGVGRGYQSIEFNAFGIPLSEARARTDESIEIIKRLWTSEGPLDFEGRFFTFSGIALQPKPLQRPHPPPRAISPPVAMCGWHRAMQRPGRMCTTRRR